MMFEILDFLLEAFLELLVELCCWCLAELWRGRQEIFR
jgi:hypothetical protein